MYKFLVYAVLFDVICSAESSLDTNNEVANITSSDGRKRIIFIPDYVIHNSEPDFNFRSRVKKILPDYSSGFRKKRSINKMMKQSENDNSTITPLESTGVSESTTKQQKPTKVGVPEVNDVVEDAVDLEKKNNTKNTTTVKPKHNPESVRNLDNSVKPNVNEATQQKDEHAKLEGDSVNTVTNPNTSNAEISSNKHKDINKDIPVPTRRFSSTSSGDLALQESLRKANHDTTTKKISTPLESKIENPPKTQFRDHKTLNNPEVDPLKNSNGDKIAKLPPVNEIINYNNTRRLNTVVDELFNRLNLLELKQQNQEIYQYPTGMLGNVNFAYPKQVPQMVQRPLLQESNVMPLQFDQTQMNYPLMQSFQQRILRPMGQSYTNYWQNNFNRQQKLIPYRNLNSRPQSFVRFPVKSWYPMYYV